MTKTHEIKLDGYGAHTTLAEDRPVMLLGTAESYGIEMLHIVPGKDWAELTITATFNASDGSSTDVLMDTDGNIAVPTEATAKSGSGRIVFTGVSNGIQRISCDLDYFVVAHSAINGTQSGGVAPSWFEQAANRFMPLGGTTGQVLTKKTDADFDAEWQDSKGGGGTTDHSKLINRDIADQHPISAITGLEETLTPLTGTTETLTPTQVYDAIKSGKSVVLQHTDSRLGLFTFASFNIFEGEKAVVSTSIAKTGSTYLVGSLAGNAIHNMWEFNVTTMAEADDISVAVNNALAQAKASGEFDGKSAYAYAQDGGYTGTEAEFAAKLAKEKFANPNALTFTGAVEGSYDGSEPLNVKIPGGGGAAVETWDLLINAEIAEDCTEAIFNSGDAGETLSDYKELLVLIDLFGNTGGFTTALKIGFLNAVQAWNSPYGLHMTGYSAEPVKYYINMFRFKKTEYGILPVNRYTQYNQSSMSNGLFHTSGITPPVVTTDFTLPISANQHVTTDMTDFTSQKEFERLRIGGYQAVIGAGTIIKVWGMK